MCLTVNKDNLVKTRELQNKGGTLKVYKVYLMFDSQTLKSPYYPDKVNGIIIGPCALYSDRETRDIFDSECYDISEKYVINRGIYVFTDIYSAIIYRDRELGIGSSDAYIIAELDADYKDLVAVGEIKPCYFTENLKAAVFMKVEFPKSSWDKIFPPVYSQFTGLKI